MPTSRQKRWLVVQAIVWTAFLVAAWRLSPAPGWLMAFGGAGVALSYAALWRILGAGKTVADLVTLARLSLLVLAAAAIVLAGRVGVFAWLALCAAVAGDLLDGWCARRFGGSDHGAVLDMETDQLATLVLSVLAFAVAGVGAQVLLLPAFRYAWVFAAGPLGVAAHDPNPRGDNRQARLLCAAVMVLLLVTLVPVASRLQLLRDLAAWLAVAAFSWSYVSDGVYLLSRRHRPAAAQ